MAKDFFIRIIRFYQRFLSPDKGIFKKNGPTCVFYPTCSEYSIQSVSKYGLFKGLFLSGRRILRCHPWQKSHVDLLN